MTVKTAGEPGAAGSGFVSMTPEVQSRVIVTASVGPAGLYSLFTVNWEGDGVAVGVGVGRSTGIGSGWVRQLLAS